MTSPTAAPKESAACALSTLATAASASEKASASDQNQGKAKSNKLQSKGKKPQQTPKRRRTTTDDPTKRPRRRHTQTERPSLPSILMGMLLNPKNADTISFLSDERRFIIVNPIDLETNVLPLYWHELGSTKISYQQFITMLIYWGFTISNHEKYPDINVYSHQMFKKGDWERCLQITAAGPSALEATLLNRMDASRASRRLSGVGLNGDHVAMRSFLQSEMYRKLSLSAPLPPSMRMQEGQDVLADKSWDVTEKKEEETTNENTESDDKEKAPTNDSTTDSNKIMSEAVAALHEHPKPFRRPSLEQMDSSQLNAMTEQFLQRSMTRRHNSRQMFGHGKWYGMMNHDVMKEVGARVDAQAKVLFAQRRRSSLAMQQMMSEGDTKEAAASEEAQNSKEGESACEDTHGKEEEENAASKETQNNIEESAGSKNAQDEKKLTRNEKGRTDVINRKVIAEMEEGEDGSAEEQTD